MERVTTHRTKADAFFQRRGLSLLEVMISTVILATGALLLFRIINSADRYAQRAEQRVMAQMICQNKLDEILAGIEPLEPFEPRPSLYYPNWYYSVTLQEQVSTKENALNPLVLLEVSSFHLERSDPFGEIPRPDLRNQKPIFSLRRILRKPDPTEESLPFSLIEGGFK
ncbi:MAG: prepilin-type N-terminal cleavage/methylation domain-containing protein [Planctomycetota bacterium]|nr:prepilin-type N-terminal cleavage/methylation domain-containing protein [Planctomycetota bacterium]